MLTTSPNGIKQLMALEGLRTHLYTCAAGVLTIGVGHAITKDERKQGYIMLGGTPVYYDNGLSVKQVEQLLAQDLKHFERTVNRTVMVTLNQNQFDALVSLCYNIGAGAFLGSTLLRVLNHGDYAGVPDQMRRWNRAAGVTLDGLVKRREKEIKLYLTSPTEGVILPSSNTKGQPLC
jgi:lysozyme